MIIRRIGRYLEIDASGNIVPDVSLNHMTREWQKLVHRLKMQAEVDLYDSSIYIRGSVPRGLAIDGVSDLDVVVLSADPKSVASQLDELASICLTGQSVCSGLEYEIHRPENLQPMVTGVLSTLHKALKTSGLSVAGIDPVATLPIVHLEEMWGMYLKGIPDDWNKCQSALASAEAADPAGEIAGWFARRLLRGAFEALALLRIRRYSRDLYLCWEAVSECAPSFKQPMWEVLELAVNPSVFSAREALERLRRAVCCVDSARKN